MAAITYERDPDFLDDARRRLALRCDAENFRITQMEAERRIQRADYRARVWSEASAALLVLLPVCVAMGAFFVTMEFLSYRHTVARACIMETSGGSQLTSCLQAAAVLR